MGIKNSNLKKPRILILSYDDYYTNKLYSNISQKELISEIDPSGFIQDDVIYSKLEFSAWYLSTKNRHLWKHHYIGSQGVIMAFAFTNHSIDSSIINEALSAIFDVLLKEIPFLVLLDSDNKYLQSEFIVELNKMKKLEVDSNHHIDKDNIFVDSINFNKGKIDIQRGLNWLCDEMFN